MPKKKSSKTSEPIPVFIAILTPDGTIHVELASKIVQIVADCLKSKQYEPTLRFSKVTGVDYNRNQIVKDFLETKCKWLLMIDHDNPPLKNPLDLIAFNKDVMCLPTMMWRTTSSKDNNEGLAYNVYRKVPGGWMTKVYDGKSKLFQADRVGSGCLLIKRRVLEKMKDSTPFLSAVNLRSGIKTQGEDIMFSDRARLAGFKLWGHWDYCCSHYKEIDLLDVAQLILNIKRREESSGPDPIIKIKK